MASADSGNEKIIITPLQWKNLISFLSLRSRTIRETRYLVGGSKPGEKIRFLLKLFLDGRNMHTLLASDQENLIGYASLLLPRLKEFQNNVYLASVSVLPVYRGQGVGTKLLAAAENFARGRGAARLELEVFAKNEKAIKLYGRLGYVQEGRRKGAAIHAGGLDDVVFMTKFLD